MQISTIIIWTGNHCSPVATTAMWVDLLFSVASHCWHDTQWILVEWNVHQLALCRRSDRKYLWLNTASGTSRRGWKWMRRGQKQRCEWMGEQRSTGRESLRLQGATKRRRAFIYACIYLFNKNTSWPPKCYKLQIFLCQFQCLNLFLLLLQYSIFRISK